ncbi:MAG: AIPR family protein, partial [Verrucomicrobiota bacterium]
MDPALWESLCRFARGDISVFDPEMGGGAHAELNPDSPLTFSRFSVYLAVHRLDLPVRAYDQAFTEGQGELGFDGIVVSLGAEPFPIEDADPTEAAEGILVRSGALGRGKETDQTLVPTPRVLFVQAKREPKTPMREVDYFGACAERFLSFDESEFRSLNPNPLVLDWWRIFDGIRRAYEIHGIPFQPEVNLIFAYSGCWTEPVGPAASRDLAKKHLGRVVPPEQVKYTMWGCNQLNEAVQWASQAVTGRLVDAELIPLPKSVAEGYNGWIPASSIITLVPEIDGHPDERVFLDNVRSFLGCDEEDERINPGAVALQKTLQEGEGAQVILRHNGFTIVARGVERMEDGSLLLREYQIVNGAQSANVLFQNKDKLDGVYLPLKLVITEDDEVKNGVILGANTQAPVGLYDMLSRERGVREIHQAFNAVSYHRPDKVWLQRRRREWIPRHGYQELRFVTPRQLMEGF